VDWGLPAEKIRVEDYGRDRVRRPAPDRAGEPTRLAFFGQINYYKGIFVLLRAMKTLADWDSRATLCIRGANLDIQGGSFRAEFERLLAATAGNVEHAGPYEHADLADLMSGIDWVVVPSIWWENSPLVIQEAFLHGRPVICSDIGGMAEKVADGVSGLHFRAGDPLSLARVLQSATASRELWRDLRAGIPEVYPMDSHIAALSELYGDLLGAGMRDAKPPMASA
jgi:glycosyltransferase involved in cell wall biosynthesis